MILRTGLPANFYSLFLKVIVCVILFSYLIDNLLLPILLGIVSGTLIHVFTNYHDSIVQLKGDTLTFYFIRPFFFKEEYRLNNLDYAEIIKETPDKMLKDVWWKADSFIPISYSKLVMYKGEFTYETRFHTNQADLPKLEAAIQKIFQNK
ncbi:hypothetical protein [Pontibacter burrus]|uniref:Uncharacterized protein n=1 Tax=Pontibacter burrus TaxID=2704466 RepID=A0A6B3LQ74_9BACT|nr:hypothetical protein [Pontibacter burrus]NEM97235.1 hypothetical protein [Pontibacter burrus]